MVASHSLSVGSRQSPGAEPSVNMQSPFFNFATAFFASSQLAEDKQFGSFNQISPVSVSVTVPFPQSAYRFVLSPHGPAALAKGIGSDGVGGVDVMDASVGPAGMMRMTASPSSMAMK